MNAAIPRLARRFAPLSALNAAALIRRALSRPAPAAALDLTEYAVFVGGSRVSPYYSTADAALLALRQLPPQDRAAALILDDLGRCIIR